MNGRKIRLHPRAVRRAGPSGLGAADLEKALAENRVTIVVQPQIDLATGGLLGVETLARLRDAEGRMVPPSEFIPLAERDRPDPPARPAAFRPGLRRRLPAGERGHSELRVAINLSARQLGDAPRRSTCCSAFLASSGADPRQLEVELTESAAIASFAVVRHRQLQQHFRTLDLGGDRRFRHRLRRRWPICWSSRSTASRSTASSSAALGHSGRSSSPKR